MGAIINYYKKLLVHRYDDNGYIKYFSADDFNGLKCDKFAFVSGSNRLKGNFYYYEGCKEDELIIFCHGIGGGHRSYMMEIELLCRNGYRVLAYDNTGCFESEGESIRGLSQSLADLDAAISYLKKNGELEKYSRVYVIGHSWGGYAAGNIANYQDDIDKVVVISGFVSVDKMLVGFLGGELTMIRRFLFKRILNYEKKMNPKYYESSSLDAINNEKSKFLLIHSKNDPMVAYENGAGFISRNTTNKKVNYILNEDRLHNPNYTLDAVTYMNEVLGGFGKVEKELKTLEEKKKFFKDVDWVRMTKQDEELWSKVLDFIKNSDDN